MPVLIAALALEIQCFSMLCHLFSDSPPRAPTACDPCGHHRTSFYFAVHFMKQTDRLNEATEGQGRTKISDLCCFWYYYAVSEKGGGCSVEAERRIRCN